MFAMQNPTEFEIIATISFEDEHTEFQQFNEYHWVIILRELG